MRKFIRVLTALILALSLTSLTACDILNGIFGTPSTTPPPSSSEDGDGDGDGDTVVGGTVYEVEFETNGGTLTGGFTTYTSGAAKSLPQTVTKDYYVFDGWYEDELFNGNAVTEISATDSGNKTFYAKWTPETYTVELYIGGIKYAGTDNVTSYSYNAETALPVPVKNSFNFNGWYADESCSGTKITSIEQGEYGNKTYYGEWVPVIATELNILHSGGYEEGAYVEFINVQGLTLADYEVSYKKSGSTSYTEIDSQLIRMDEDNIVRADIVGISEGAYTIQVVAGNKGVVTADVTATAYDRSGYAHFGAETGVGAYNDDGTPKANAEIIYVTESNKNTVTASYLSGSGDENKGIVAVLRDVYKAVNPVIIRFVGRVSAATWNEITYSEEEMNSYPTLYANNKQLPTSGLTQAELIAGGYNTLNTTEYSVLNNLSSYASYSSSEYDTCWNDCPISGSTSKPPKNVTVEGIGTNAEIFQWGMTWKYAHSVEVRNLKFSDYTEDACSFQGGSKITDSERIWVHNCTFNRGKNYWDLTDEQDKHDGDGATDFKWATYITISYCHYVNNHKTGLIGANSSSLTSNVTFHHNYYDGCESRLPLSRQANMHMYNNYYHNANTSISLRAYAYAFIEYCYFDGANNTMIDIQGANKTTAESYGVAKIYNCALEGKGYSYQEMPASELPTTDTTAMHTPFIFLVNDRTQQIDSFNQFCKNFDTNSTYFYYDSINKKSDVTNLITDLNEVKTLVPSLAGVHKN